MHRPHRTRPPRPHTPAAVVDHKDLTQMGVAWLAAVRAHRAAGGRFGRVTATLIDTVDGTELHLTEETTFRAVGRTDPYREAARLVDERAAAKSRDGSTGRLAMETEYRHGAAVLSRVTETTIVQHQRIEAATLGESPLDAGPAVG